MKSTAISLPLIRKNLCRHWLLFLPVVWYFISFAGKSCAVLILYNLAGEVFTPEGTIREYFLCYDWWDFLFDYDIGIFELWFSFLTALLSFTYLHKKKEEQFLRSLPMGQNSLYLSSLLSGFLFYAIPWLVTLVLSTPVVIIGGKGNSSIWGVYLFAMGFRLFFFFLLYSMAILAMVLCGRRFFSLILLFGFHVAAPLLVELITLCLEDNLFGLSYEPGFFAYYFSPYAYFREIRHYFIPNSTAAAYTPVYKFIPWGDIGIYTVVAVLLFLLSGYLCKKRKAENTEQSLAFPSVTIFVQYLLTLMAAYFLATVLSELRIIWDYDSPLLIPVVIMIPFAFFLCRMIILRTVKVFRGKALIQCGAMVLFFVCVVLFFRFDVLKLTRHTPEPEDVQRLSVSMNGMTYTTDDPEDICDFIKVHEIIVGLKDVLPRKKVDPTNNPILQWDVIMEDEPVYYGISYCLDITYEMKGRDIHRVYTLNPHSYGSESDLIWSALQLYFQDGDRATEQVLGVYDDIQHIYISDRLWESPPDTLDGESYTLSTAQAKDLFQALLTDIEAVNKPLILQDGSLYGVEIHIYTKDGKWYRFYLDYYCHETARNVLDSILDTYKSPS